MNGRWWCVTCKRFVRGDEVSHLSRWYPNTLRPSAEVAESGPNARYHPTTRYGPEGPCGPLRWLVIRPVEVVDREAWDRVRLRH